LLILDVRLPKVNGLDILKEVKRNLEVRNGNYKLRIANYKEVEFKNCELVAACSLKDKQLSVS